MYFRSCANVEEPERTAAAGCRQQTRTVPGTNVLELPPSCRVTPRPRGRDTAADRAARRQRKLSQEAACLRGDTPKAKGCRSQVPSCELLPPGAKLGTATAGDGGSRHTAAGGQTRRPTPCSDRFGVARPGDPWGAVAIGAFGGRPPWSPGGKGSFAPPRGSHVRAGQLSRLGGTSNGMADGGHVVAAR